MWRVGAALVLGILLAGCSSNGGPKSVPPHHSAASSPSVTPRLAKQIDPGFNSALWIPNRSRVLGKWTIVSVNGNSPPKDAAPLNMIRAKGGFFAVWSDGINSHSQQWTLIRGSIRWGGGMVTTKGCGPIPMKDCVKPGGFGVGKATRLKMSNDGELVFMDQTSMPLAVYKYISPRNFG